MPSFDLDLSSGTIRAVEAIVATIGGLALFLLLVTRRRREEPVLAPAGDVAPPAEEAPPVSASSLVLPDEASLPRWLRPSVQTARYGRIRDR